MASKPHLVRSRLNLTSPGDEALNPGPAIAAPASRKSAENLHPLSRSSLEIAAEAESDAENQARISAEGKAIREARIRIAAEAKA